MKNHDLKNSATLPPGAGAALTTLLAGIDYVVIQAGRDGDRAVIQKITSDSRAVTDGALFVALPGTVTDGHLHIGAAVDKGCSAIVVQEGSSRQLPSGWSGTVIEVKDCRRAYAQAAENYYGCPADSLKLIGVTGTNGKTTITYLLEDVLEHLGHRVGVIGTVNYRYHGARGRVVLPSPFTTPEAMQLQALLFEMVGNGVEYVIMEVSSHALAQHRIGNILFDVAAFTNLSQDHLDYHLSMEEYFQSKTMLFDRHLKDDGTAVISSPQQPGEGPDWSGRMAEFCGKRQVALIRCGLEDDAAVRVLDYSSSLQETWVRLQVQDEIMTLTTPLVGHYNVDNLVSAFTILHALGIVQPEAVRLLSRSTGAPGRLQRIQADDGTSHERPVVFVDYAHTPDALKQVLVTLKSLPHRELYCVFGCGGNRDTRKRPLMGGFAGTYSDVVIVTDDNPRSEVPEEIRNQIVPGVEKAGLARQEDGWLLGRNKGERGFVVIGSRREAIARAVRSAGAGDIVLIAGKGHEKYQLGSTGRRFFDDCLEAETALLAWNLEAVALATGGNLVNPSGEQRFLGDVSTDSRTIAEGDIFVALQGEKFDGHAFIQAVSEKGAGCLVVEQGHAAVSGSFIPRVEVADTLQALGDLARFRRRLTATVQKQVVIGLTGSCGKTTVKEMTAAILRRRWPEGIDCPADAVLQTRGNLNNLIGLPLSLLPITPRHRAAVLEMGMNAPGEIRSMARIAEPDICCITNIHGVHLAGLHDLDGVAAAKGELFAEAGDNTILVVNLDDDLVVNLAARYPQNKMYYSARDRENAGQADLYASAIEPLAGGVITFNLHRGEEREQVHLHAVGLHNVANSVAAAAIATAAGTNLAEIAAGLADFRPSDRRMVQMKTLSGVGVLNDTYNANPASMEAGLKTLVQMGGTTSAALLGDMLELGESSEKAHRQLGRQAAQLGVTYLGIVGQYGGEVARGAREQGMRPDMVRVFADKDKAAEWIEGLQEAGELVAGDWLLVKASRGLRMETIVARLTGNT